MKLKIVETQPWYILPTQRYDLTTRPPSKSMQGDYTFFCSFKVNKKIKTTTPCSIMMRPGMHHGLCYAQDPEAINWEYWYKDELGENKFGFLSVNLSQYHPQHKLENTWFCVIRHITKDKAFTLHIYDEDGKQTTMKSEYSGELINYSGTPYNFGCGNYFKQVNDSHYFFGDYTMFNVGMIESLDHDDEAIQEFISINKDSFDKLEKKGKLNELLFYFNFNNTNIYKAWDLSDHCNFLMKNVDVFK